ncbi:hypothetical protein [Desulfitobacterium hafniense]|uniref:hypothetical protein n=1 Tax=Desulfitobacterium hafniense TaxID=49338 RepID=UPI0002F08FD0|nr:hypothetical protein [Desulfitobacterium hafniense]
MPEPHEDEGGAEITLTRDQLRVLRDGLCVWNTIILDSLTERGRLKLYAAQDLIEKLWKGV